MELVSPIEEVEGLTIKIVEVTLQEGEELSITVDNSKNHWYLQNRPKALIKLDDLNNQQIYSRLQYRSELLKFGKGDPYSYPDRDVDLSKLLFAETLLDVVDQEHLTYHFKVADKVSLMWVDGIKYFIYFSQDGFVYSPAIRVTITAKSSNDNYWSP